MTYLSKYRREKSFHLPSSILRWTPLNMHEIPPSPPLSRQKQLPSSPAITDILFPPPPQSTEERWDMGREKEVSTVTFSPQIQANFKLLSQLELL